jgi:CHAT domain-containing protein
LHAAWHHDAVAPSGRRYSLDERQLSYAANARVLAGCRARADRLATNSIVVIADAERLPHADAEVEAARRHFPLTRRLRDDELATADVLGALAEHHVTHFACHGTADPLDPGESRLELSARHDLTVREVVQGRMHQTRLAVLSACETAVSGSELPDEALGLPASFIEAGAAGVVGSLWRVPDLSTMLLMRRFYELWRIEAADPPEALRRAQQWLRDAPNREKRDRFPDVAELSGGHVPEWARSDWEETSDHTAPLHWAAFSYLGA